MSSEMKTDCQIEINPKRDRHIRAPESKKRQTTCTMILNFVLVLECAELNEKKIQVHTYFKVERRWIRGYVFTPNVAVTK